MRPNGVLVTENRGKGIRFTRIRIVVGPGKEGVVYKTADFHKPWNDRRRRPIRRSRRRSTRSTRSSRRSSARRSASATKAIPRADQCGARHGRTCESLVGNVVTDAMRTAYAGIGVQFAITNSGGLRADLTCPTADLDGRLLPVVHAAAVPDHARPVAGRAPVREHRRHDERERRRAEDDARERRLA